MNFHFLSGNLENKFNNKYDAHHKPGGNKMWEDACSKLNSQTSLRSRKGEFIKRSGYFIANLLHVLVERWPELVTILSYFKQGMCSLRTNDLNS